MAPKSKKKVRVRTDVPNVGHQPNHDAGLPNDVAALHFVCRCFGIGEKEMLRTLERVRSFTKDADDHFPRTFHRMLLTRSQKGNKQWDKALLTIQREALYDQIRRQDGKPLFGFAGDFAERLASSMTLLYERLLPKLNVEGIPGPTAIWILLKNIFVPTAYAELVKNWRLGLGGEFRGPTCWYLPLGPKHKQPVSRVLDCWLRVAGFLTGYRISQEMEKMDRSQVDEWRRGEKVPNPLTLHRVVEKFAGRVSWLDDAEEWKSRFTLACAMQNLSARMDEYFKHICSNSSLELAGMFQKIADEHIVCGETNFLAEAHNFFATRLLQTCIRKEGQWVAEFNMGDRFLKLVNEKAGKDESFRRNIKILGERLALEEYLFDVGVRELNRLFEIERKRIGGRRKSCRRP
jgi:hypothetical protein